ncbi:RNA dependent RNA polymerase [Priestia aryabhattai]|uniref:RNA dependent RNA polymerase n=1 Tax=Priestia aryabhattai TaxID=412384 RepID=UPI0015F672A6|nr:hypothetical protein [Priestia aryabhattai]
MKNNRFFTYKFKSSRLKEFNYNIELNFNDALQYGEVIALFDNQMLRSIRKIKDRDLDEKELNSLIERKNELKRSESTKENKNEIIETKDKINEMLFIPEYITIVMENNSHYDYLYKNGLTLNGRAFVRFSSSAGQARVSTVVFVEEETAKELQIIMDNGRNLDKKLVPSKYNAYKGLAGSATQIVSSPKFCVVKDYESESTYTANYVIETDHDKDDEIEKREITEMFNRFDGQGLISYEQSKKWADELGLDYVPAQWCVRQNFIKGMLNTFDIHRFCEEKNNGDYNIETIYEDENGNPQIIDLRNVDVILTESQFKLWDSWDSLEAYEENCEKNDLYWGVSLYSPKKDKDILRMNYQFLQTLNLNKDDIKSVCSKFVNWVNGVNSGDIYYTLLFLLGSEASEEKIMNVINFGENNWLKSLIVNHDLMKDKYVKRKIYDLIRRKIKEGCMGKILLDGNFQTLVSDPYAMMQYVCGQEVTGLLGENQHYSSYWNNKGIKTVDAMRAPLTYRSEHVLLNLQKNEETEEWYKYSYTGIIINIHGVETVRFAGSDFDFDIVATTSDETVIKGVYKDELPITYQAPKPQKIKFTDEDLFKSDKFSFGSIIGSITNKSTSAFALLAQLKEGTVEYETTLKRIKMCTKLQSAQIDKAKIGRKVKGIPPSWVNYQKIKDEEDELSKQVKELSNSIMIDRHPYFFTYLYSGTRNKYNKHFKSYDITCQQRFGKTLNELKLSKRKTKEEHEFLNLFDKYSPVIDSDCVMNNICRYIESVDFKIKHLLKTDIDENIHLKYLNDENRIFDEEKISDIVSIYSNYKKIVNQLSSEIKGDKKSKFNEEIYNEINGQHEKFKNDVLEVMSNEVELVDYLVHIFYKLNPSYNKDLLWNTYGQTIFNNIMKNVSEYMVPVETSEGDHSIDYLNKKYKLVKVEC